MSLWVLVVVLLVPSVATVTRPDLGVPSIHSATVYADRAACEAAMAVKEYELRGRRYHLACLPSARP